MRPKMSKIEAFGQGMIQRYTEIITVYILITSLKADVFCCTLLDRHVNVSYLALWAANKVASMISMRQSRESLEETWR